MKNSCCLKYTSITRLTSFLCERFGPSNVLDQINLVVLKRKNPSFLSIFGSLKNFLRMNSKQYEKKHFRVHVSNIYSSNKTKHHDLFRNHISACKVANCPLHLFLLYGSCKWRNNFTTSQMFCQLACLYYPMKFVRSSERAFVFVKF